MNELDVFVLILLYFLPVLVAYARGHHNLPAIFATTLLLGFTGIGWVVAFIWSLTNTSQEQRK